MMRESVGAVSIVIATCIISFFVVFAFHSGPEERLAAKQALLAHETAFVFAPDENQHMRDVSWVLVWMRGLAVGTLFIAALVLSRPSRRLLLGSGAALLVLLLGAIAMPWDVLFLWMHDVIFPQGNWQFPAQSTLIQTYPMRFFQVFAAVWAVCCGIAAAAFLLWGFRRPR